jgi:hypothetical protein
MNRKPPPPLTPPTLRSVESLAADVASDAEVALGAARIAKRAAESMPKPDRRLDPNFQRLTGQEQSFLARISPRRNRWPELREIDERIAELDRRQEGLSAGLVDLRGRRERADAEHAEHLAAWLAAGQAEPRPASEVRALEDAISEAAAEYAAIDSLRERVLAERIAYVERHRKRLVADAERETGEARVRYLELVDQMEQTRAALVELRETTIWASLYPSETLASFAPSHALVGGRPRETARHLAGVEQSIAAPNAFSLLRADAEHFGQVSTREQAAEMQGVSTAELTGDEAMWADGDADLARRKREKERLLSAGGNTTVDALKLLEAQRAGTPPIGSQ